MRRGNAYRILYALAVALLVGFCACLCADWLHYDGANDSAPFYVFVLVRAAEWILPSLASFAAGRIVQKKYPG